MVSFNDYNNGIIFNGVDNDVRTETFYIPETVYGISVVGIKSGRGKIYAEKVVVPNSVSQIGRYSFSSKKYPSLKTIIIKGFIKDLDADAFSSSDASYTIVFLSTTEPPKVSKSSLTLYNSQNLKFYVPNESVDKYKKSDGMVQSCIFYLFFKRISRYTAIIKQMKIMVDIIAL